MKKEFIPITQNPPCSFFNLNCGGCHLQNFANHGEYKIWQLTEKLRNIPYDILHPLVQVPHHSRIRARFQVRQHKLGFYQKHSKQLVTIDYCLLLKNEINKLINPVNKLLASLNTKIEQVGITASDTGCELCFWSDNDPELKIINKLNQFAEANGIARIIWNNQAILNKNEIIIHLAKFSINLPSNSFFQVCQESVHFIAEQMIKHMAPNSKIIELYCGVGVFSLLLAHLGKIAAYEGSAISVKTLQNLALNYKLSINAQVRDLYINPVTRDNLSKYDYIIINPPRNGATPQIKEISNCKTVKKLFLISCDVDSFIRDSKILLKNNFKLEHIYPLDQFLYSEHLELIAVYQKL